MKSPLLTSAIIVLGCFSFAFAQEKALVSGIWQNNNFGYQMIIMLNPDGTGEFNGETILYMVPGNRLTMVIEGHSITYNYVLNGNNLDLSGGDLDGNISFTRAGAQLRQSL